MALNAPNALPILLFKTSKTYLLSDGSILSRVVLAGPLRVVRYRPLPLGELLGVGLRVLLVGRHFVLLWSLVLVGGDGDGDGSRNHCVVPSCPAARTDSCSARLRQPRRQKMDRAAPPEHHCLTKHQTQKHVDSAAHHLQGWPVRAYCERIRYFLSRFTRLIYNQRGNGNQQTVKAAPTPGYVYLYQGDDGLLATP
jgi:hypothetical protein